MCAPLHSFYIDKKSNPLSIFHELNRKAMADSLRVSSGWTENTAYTRLS